MMGWAGKWWKAEKVVRSHTTFVARQRVQAALSFSPMTLALMEPSGMIEQGGPLVWVLLGLAFFGAVCVVERLFFFHRSRINVGDLLVGLSHHIRRRAFAEALHEAARAPGPVARVAHAALLRYYLSRSDLRDVVQEAGQLEVPRIEKNIRAILGAALLAPLIGLLGTMVGMLETFQKVSEQGGFTGPAELSGGVFAALITSVLGLTVAVPLYLFYLYFLGRATRLVHRIERAGIEMVHLIADAREEEEFAPFRGEVTHGKKPVKPHKEPAK
jgi:biopolymer transport protein ExbB